MANFGMQRSPRTVRMRFAAPQNVTSLPSKGSTSEARDSRRPHDELLVEIFARAKEKFIHIDAISLEFDTFKSKSRVLFFRRCAGCLEDAVRAYHAVPRQFVSMLLPQQASYGSMIL